MKTKRRQELRTNELILQLIKARDYAARNWNWIAGTALVVVLVIAIIAYWQYNRGVRRIEGLNALATVREDANLPPAEQIDRLEQIAKQYPDPQVVLASLEAVGNSVMHRLLVDWTGESPSQREKLLGAAEAAFRRIVAEFPDRHEAVVRAHLGLAAIAEDRGDREEAARQYKAILDDPKLAAVTMYQGIAAARAGTLDERMKPVEILPATRPAATRTATSPTTTQAATMPVSAPGASRPTGVPATAPAVP
ncbi:MAG: tetratricopeptide repeat protein [Phycisphaerae bacterium]